MSGSQVHIAFEIELHLNISPFVEFQVFHSLSQLLRRLSSESSVVLLAGADCFPANSQRLERSVYLINAFTSPDEFILF